MWCSCHLGQVRCGVHVIRCGAHNNANAPLLVVWIHLPYIVRIIRPRQALKCKLKEGSGQIVKCT